MDIEGTETSAGGPSKSSNSDTDIEDEYDELEYNDEFESMLQAAESQAHISPQYQQGAVALAAEPPLQNVEAANVPSTWPVIQEDAEIQMLDIEDMGTTLLSPFERFRQRGTLSVSDLVGTVWCEVQYDYRLRTLPYLPPSKRPAVITSDKGKEIVVDKGKEEGRERIVRRGEKIHKRLEREIHPDEVVVTTDSREDVWGLRFLNMLAAMEALITLGTCREVPVVGFVGGVLVTGIIDELNRKPIDKAQAKPQTRSSRQMALTSFFSPSKDKGKSKAEPPSSERIRTHKVYVSDSKTRARDSLPREADTLAGQLQCMMYKELLDAMLLSSSLTPESIGEDTSYLAETVVDPSSSSQARHHFRPSVRGLSFQAVFDHLGLRPREPFSERFIAQTRPIVLGNGLRLGTAEARCLADVVRVWERYVADLGLGTARPVSSYHLSPRSASGRGKAKAKAKSEADENDGRTENRLELVYRRAGPKKEMSARSGTGRRRRQRGEQTRPEEGADTEMRVSTEEEFATSSQIDRAKEAEEERLIDLALTESLESADPTPTSADGSVSVELAASPPQTPRPFSRISEYRVERTSDEEKEEDELAWAVEMSLADAQVDDSPGQVAVPLSQRSTTSDTVLIADRRSEAAEGGLDADGKDDLASSGSSASSTPPPVHGGTTSGSIIGRHRFQHDPTLLEKHLESVMQYWRGQREPVGVSVEDTKRCGWCEFEDGCEWRAKKAQEEWDRSRASKRV